MALPAETAFRSLLPLFLAASAHAQPSGLFDYDHSVPFRYQEEMIERDAGIDVAGAGFQSPKGGKVNMIVVRPRGKGPYAGIVWQHGGDQSMLTYLSEARVLARAGAVSLILDAPGAVSGRKPANEMSGAELRDYNAEIVICERRAVDYLETLENVDPARIAFAGHSYGAITGGVLVGIEKRFKTFILLGGVARYTRHVSEAPVDYWIDWRKRMTPEQLAAALRELRPVDPDNYVGVQAHGPIFVQCGSFDFINKEGCGGLYRAASSPKEIRWYNTDHSFADIEAAFDRMEWLQRELSLKPVLPLLDRLWKNPRKRSAALDVK